MSIHKIIYLFLSLLLTLPMFSQQINFQRDTAVVFQPVDPLITKSNSEIKNSWGLDLIISTNGFGLGAFYGYEFSDELTGKINFSISEGKDEGEMEVYNPYTGVSVTPDKVNRFIVLPLLFVAEYRLFKDEILDNFRPYVTAAAGPTMIYSTPYEREFFNSLKYGQAHYTAGGYIGIGAFFGSERSNVLGMNIRYYVIPYPKGIESMYKTTKKEFGGISLSISFGSGW
ncbi:MAG: hypothetical protein KKG06_08190 [Bacteroidetes bacterium]|nr:hypothetical protein [Bacteroidota bacterium]MBU1423143.1 hypothetical protein [Bacteroidota bacterium]